MASKSMQVSIGLDILGATGESDSSKRRVIINSVLRDHYGLTAPVSDGRGQWPEGVKDAQMGYARHAYTMFVKAGVTNATNPWAQTVAFVEGRIWTDLDLAALKANPKPRTPLALPANTSSYPERPRRDA